MTTINGAKITTQALKNEGVDALLAEPAKYEAESATNGMHKWGALDVP
jgi:hypothetical protein